MPYSDAAKDAMLDHLGTLADSVSIHTGDPGAAGTNNEVTGGGYSRQTPTWTSSSGGSMHLDANLDFDGPPNEDATWFAIWDNTTFLGRGQITTGDTTFNASGEFSLTTATDLQVVDPT